MTNIRSFAIWATAALLLGAGSVCSDSSSDPRTSTPSSSSPSTPSSSTTASQSELASQNAETVVRQYFAEIDRLRQQPQLPLRSLRRVATSGELTSQQRLIEGERRQGRKQTGDTKLAQLTVQSVNLDNSDPESGEVPTAQVDVCWDVSAVDIVDRGGESVVAPSRPDTGWLRLTVANYQWDRDRAGGWRVASSQDLEQAPCAAS